MAGAQQYPTGCLYVVATPIGNLADLTLRAVHVLSLADAVACEDTRVTGGLLQRLGLHRPLLAVHQHNEARVADQVVARLAAGERIAYASDAGTPAVSDPGARLVAAVQAAGLRVMPIPGASSVAAAVSVAGDVADAERGYRFVGFVPAKPKARTAWLDEVLAAPDTVVFFEAPHRVVALAAVLAEHAPARKLTVCRELTKQFEEVVSLTAEALPAWLMADAQRQRGEFVFVLHAPPAQQVHGVPDAVWRVLRELMQHLPLRHAVTVAADATGAPRNELYAQALAWQAEAQDAGAPPGVDGSAD